MLIDGVNVYGVSEEDAKMLVTVGKARYADLKKVEAYYDGEFINAHFHYGEGRPFERIRRVTGYLSSVDRWNNGKKAELADRVKHPLK